MRKARIKAENGGFYHVMSRVIEGRSIFGPDEKERFRHIMRQMEAFCGLKILTYSVMSTHNISTPWSMYRPGGRFPMQS